MIDTTKTTKVIADLGDPEHFKPGSFGCHEAMHMASVLAETIDERLCQHPAILLKPEWRKLADQACDVLHQLYQNIAREHTP